MVNFTILGALVIFAYLLGSVPWGLVLTRWFGAEDIRRNGSGNIGATNVTRVAGKTLGVLTLAGDVLKGGVPVYLAGCLLGSSGSPWGDAGAALAGISAFFGHLYPIYLRFKTGGKGVATAGGFFLVISPAACVGAMAVFCLLVWRYRFVSAGSLAAAAVLPLFVALWGNSLYATLAAIVVALFIFLRHAANIRRLRDGTEPTFRV